MEEMDIDMTPYLGKPLDINSICRACLGIKGEMRPLYGSCLDEMLTSFVGIQFKQGDGFPSLLCLQCILQISRSFTFKKQCLKSAWTLKKFLSPEFQARLADFQKPICETVSNNQMATLKVDNNLLKTENITEVNEFDHIEMGNEILLNPCEDEVKTVTLAQLNQTPFDNVNVADNIMISVKLNNLAHFDDGIVVSSKNDITPTHILEIRPDWTAHIVTNKDANTFSDENQELPTNSLQDKDVVLNEGKEEYKCTRCDAVFDMKLGLKIHMAFHQFDNYCKTCGKTFQNVRTLNRHLKTHSVVKPHVCNICHKAFSESSNLTKHKKRHTGELRNIQGKQHLCSVCGRSFKWSTSLSKHFKYHTGKKLLSCNYCPKQYAEARSLKIHIRSHTGEKPYICQICNQGFTQQSNLEKHIRVHMGQKPYACPVCGKGFSQKTCVTIHMRTHTGEKPYTCSICKKSFTGASTLNIHRRVHTGEKPFQCTICTKLFTRHETLVIHQRSHTGEKPHVCTICTRGFTSSGHLSTHMRTHTGEKPYACTECDKRFSASSSLKLHMRSHISAEKPFNCNICGKGFADSSSLAVHHAGHMAHQVTEPVDGKDALLSISVTDTTMDSMRSSPLSWS